MAQPGPSSGAPAAKPLALHRDEAERQNFALGQSLVTLVNNPKDAAAANKRWPFALGRTDSDAPTQLPPLDEKLFPNVQKHDLTQYMQQVASRYKRFMDDRKTLTEHYKHEEERRDGARFAELLN